MATAKNTTQRAGARVAPKSAPKRPAAPSALNAATDALNGAVGEFKHLNAFKRPAANVLDALLDLEKPLHDLDHLARIVADWADDQVFYHPIAQENDDTNRQRARQVEGLMFAVGEIAKKAADLNVAFHAAFKGSSGRATS
jgi:hypothetical protein